VDTPGLREQVSERIEELTRRIQCIEREAEARGFDCGRGVDPSKPLNPILEQTLAPTRRELAKAEATIRRIDRREADYCIHCGRRIEPERLALSPYSASCAECVSGFPASYADEIRFQHRGLRAMLLELLELTARVRRELEADHPCDVEICACAAVLQNFARELPHHFATEEKDGYLAEALAAAPRFQRRIDRLGRQHPAMLEELRSVHASFAEIEAATGWLEFQRALQGFTSRLFEHEAAEHDVLQSALLDDIGGG
jgi:RNA polymerase-binding transcription factor DksA